MEQNEDDKREPEQQALNDYGRYTGIAFQMIAIIGIFTFLGFKLDKWLDLNYPIFTIVLIFLSLIASLYSIIKSLK